MPIRKIQAGYISTVTADQYVGEPGTIFYNADLGDLRLSDGNTLGGVALSTGSGSATSYISLGTSNVRVYSSHVNISISSTTIASFSSNLITIGSFSFTNSGVRFPDGSYQFTANAGSSGTTYSNANVKSYLSSYDGNIVPTTSNVYSLGDSTHWWKDLYVSGGTIYIGGTPVSVESGNLKINNQVVATSTEGTVYFDANTALSVSGNTLLLNGQAVQASGIDWANVSNRPSIPTDLSQLTDVNNVISSVALPTAAADTKGGVKIGDNINISADGKISVPKGAGINKVVDIPDVNSAGKTNGSMLVYNAGGDRWDTKAQTDLGAFNLDGGEF